MMEWLRAAREPSVVRRALKYAVIVGAVLITINHGDALLKGDITTIGLVKMGLTVMVPYLVSTLSSVGAIRALRKKTYRDETTDSVIRTEIPHEISSNV